MMFSTELIFCEWAGFFFGGFFFSVLPTPDIRFHRFAVCFNDHIYFFQTVEIFLQALFANLETERSLIRTAVSVKANFWRILP